MFKCCQCKKYKPAYDYGINYTVNTNKNNMELFTTVADMLGEGLPLSYLFITIEVNAALKTKQNKLIAWN